MKQKISPVYAVIALVAILGIAGLAFWRYENAGPPPGDASGSGMPPQVAEELQRKMGGVQPPAAR